MLKDLQVPKGEYMIQSAANSTLGKQVISLANRWGIKTINVVRRARATAQLKYLGADEVRPCWQFLHCQLYSLLVTKMLAEICIEKVLHKVTEKLPK